MDLSEIKNIIMTAVNGRISVSTAAIQSMLDTARHSVAKIKHATQVGRLVSPDMAKLKEENVKLETDKTSVQSDAVGIDIEIAAKDKEIESKEVELEQAKAEREKQRNSDNPPSDDDKVPTLRNELTNLKKEREELINRKQDNDKKLKEIDDKINTNNKSIQLMEAQMDPDAAKATAKTNKESAQETLNNAPTPEARKEAERQLQDAEEMEKAVNDIADNNDAAINAIEEQQEPKMRLLRAEYQLMDTGVKVFNYLLTNMEIQTPLPGAIGAASPNPARILADGNVNYGILYYIVETLKASSIRFLAAAEEINYTPTTEMTVINMIPICEQALGSFIPMAPAGASLNV